MRFFKYETWLIFLILCTGVSKKMAASADTLRYTVDLIEAGNHLFNVTLQLQSPETGVIDFKIPQWTPGYYQLLRFSENVEEVRAFTGRQQPLPVVKTNANTWRVAAEKGAEIILTYKVLADKNFIAIPYIDKDCAFIRPTGVFLYPSGMPDAVAVISLENIGSGQVATGLEKRGDVYFAESIDQLFDSPILTGDVQKLGEFEVKGIPHYFWAREIQLQPGDGFITDLKKMVETAVDLMGDIPYRGYTFMGIGKGNGGIEQLNSTAFALSGESLQNEGGRKRAMNFLTHEYFHHYNIKRIRPIELGPFDYSKENRTNLLWVGEGLTVYFEDIILNRAGLQTGQEAIASWTEKIEGYENNPGKAFQTLAESSYQTWDDGPFGVRGKTISYYEKGPLIGMLLDLKIRVNTANQQSLVDMMRKLYYTFYKEKNRGYTEQEFKETCEQIAGESLDDIFDYVYTLKEIDYNKYFVPAGLCLQLTREKDKVKAAIHFVENPSDLQKKIVEDLFRIK